MRFVVPLRYPLKHKWDKGTAIFYYFQIFCDLRQLIADDHDDLNGLFGNSQHSPVYFVMVVVDTS